MRPITQARGPRLSTRWSGHCQIAVIVIAALAAHAHADAGKDQRPRILVLPLPASNAIDANVARTFDARLLVALDDSKRVVTVTASEEPDCTTMKCLAALGLAADATYVLSMSV